MNRQWQELIDAQAAVDRAENDLTEARTVRDQLLRQHSARGITAYRLAQVVGISEQRIGKILKQSPN